MGFQLKGSSSVAGSKTERTIEFKVRVLELKVIEGRTSKLSLAIACEEHNCDPVPAMIDHPASIIHGYKNSIAKKIKANDKKTMELLIKANLVEDDGQDENEDENEVD